MLSPQEIVCCDACQKTVTLAPPPQATATLLQELRSGFIPPHSRVVEFHASLQSYQLRLERINLELKSLSIPFHQLQAAQNQLQRFLDLQNALFSQIRKLPIEILHLVFDQLVEQNVVSNRTPLSCELPALLLSHVCFQWRIAARSHAPSWSNIFLAVRGHDSDPEQLDSMGREELLDMVLELSRNHPLTIRIADWQPCEGDTPAGSDETLSTSDSDLVDMVFREGHRWQALELCPFVVRHIKKHLRGSFPKLRDLSIDPEEHTRLGHSAWVGTLPSLQRLSIHAINTLRDISIDSLPLSQLFLNETRIADVLELVALPLLEILELWWLWDDEEDLSALSRKSFPNLRTLRINTIHGHERTLGRLFRHMTIPQLSVLSISGEMVSIEHWAQDEFCALLVRSGCRLTELELTELPMTEDHLLTLLPHLSHLKRLSFTEICCINDTIIPLGPAFIAKLATMKDEWISGSPFVHLPTLQDLRLDGSFQWHGSENKLDDLVDMLETRATICSSNERQVPFEYQLQKIRLRCRKALLGSSLVRRMSLLKEKGTEVDVEMGM
ncbi:hypothetical protein DL96DRAFT_537676 [Flagelloscypha sp. PMI_526]|nr:hypothetical protein DL96DRAFT_537676 [Flagelloscypha sp. PMI_526]